MRSISLILFLSFIAFTFCKETTLTRNAILDSEKDIVQDTVAHSVHQYHLLNSNKLINNAKSISSHKTDSSYTLNKEVLGWFPHWEDENYKGFNFSLLSTLAYFSYQIEPKTGNASSTGNWSNSKVIDDALDNDVKVLLTITNFGKKNNREFLRNEESINTLIKNVSQLLINKKAHGVCIDFEDIAASDADELVSFLTKLHQELQKINTSWLIYVALPAIDVDQVFTLSKLDSFVDQFVIMGYGYNGTFSKNAGPVAPLNSGEPWKSEGSLTKSVNHYLSRVSSPSKLLLALPFYGVVYRTKSEAINAKVDKLASYKSYDFIKSHFKDSVPNYDSVSATAWYSYPTNNERTIFEQCWFDDEVTLSKKFQLVNDKQLKGIGIWSMGYDSQNNNLWKSIANNFTL